MDNSEIITPNTSNIISQKISNFLGQQEEVEYKTYIPINRCPIILGVTKHRFFLFEYISKNFYSAKELNLLGLTRQKIRTNQMFILTGLLIISIFSFISSLVIFPFISNVIFTFGIFILLITLLYGLYLFFISRKCNLVINIGGLNLNYPTKVSQLNDIQKAIAILHVFGKRINIDENIDTEEKENGIEFV